MERQVRKSAAALLVASRVGQQFDGIITGAGPKGTYVRVKTPPIEGMVAYVRSVGVWACYRSGAWELGELRGNSLILDGVQVVGSRLAAISGASGGATVDAESRATIDQILAALRQHGLIES